MSRVFSPDTERTHLRTRGALKDVSSAEGRCVDCGRRMPHAGCPCERPTVREMVGNLVVFACLLGVALGMPLLVQHLAL